MQGAPPLGPTCALYMYYPGLHDMMQAHLHAAPTQRVNSSLATQSCIQWNLFIKDLWTKNTSLIRTLPIVQAT